jgi:hypothetical protein
MHRISDAGLQIKNLTIFPIAGVINNIFLLVERMRSIGQRHAFDLQ